MIVASGGGILAAGWTTLALEKLVALRPQLPEEIRLLSGISGEPSVLPSTSTARYGTRGRPMPG